jgi:N-acetylneuraminic acid mutarotase
MAHAMASLGAVVVLFGGNTVTNSGGAYLSDTWTFDGATWTSVTTASTPSGRSGHAMATLGSKVVLFGGADATGPHDDTWTFDGTTWTQLTPAASPPARRDGAMATLGGKVVLFGGYAYVTSDASTDQVVLFDDTWTFDGTTWTQITPAASPSPRFDTAMAELGGKVVLFGGENSTTDVPPASLAAYFNDTWVFDGSTWTQLSPPTAPGVRAGHVLSAF